MRAIGVAGVIVGMLAPVSALADEPRPPFLRDSYTTSAPPAVVELAACTLKPIGMIDGHAHAFDVRFNGHPCTDEAVSAFSIAVRTVERADDQLDVVLEIVPPPDTSLADLRATLADTRAEMEQRTPPPPTPKPSIYDTAPRTVREWYGWQAILLHAASAVPIIASVFSFTSSNATPGIVLLPIGIATYAFGPPIVHWAHGHVGRGFASLGLRVVLPGAAVGIGMLAAGGCGGECAGWGAIFGAIIGGIGGAVIAPIVDGFMGWDERPAKAPVHLSPFALSGSF